MSADYRDRRAYMVLLVCETSVKLRLASLLIDGGVMRAYVGQQRYAEVSFPSERADGLRSSP